MLLPMVVVSGLVFANGKSKNAPTKNSNSKPPSTAENKSALKKWEATPDGIMFNQWKTSPAGKKIIADADKIKKSLREYTDMEAVVTSLSLPAGSRLGYGVMVKINGEDYILTMGLDNSGKKKLEFNNEYVQMHSLKVNDKIIIRSHGAMYAPKYSYTIVMGSYVERDGKVIYQRSSGNDGC